MIPILSDIHLAEGVVKNQHLNNDSATKLYNKYYWQIFEIHNVTQKQFFRSFNYYQRHPELFEELYADLLTKINTETMLIKKKPGNKE